MRELFSELERWQSQGEEIAMATLVRVRGSAPRLPGARLWVTRGGRMIGSVSGGCVENDVYAHALQVLDSRQPVMASYGIADELGFAVGLSCGGSIDVLIAPFIEDEVWNCVRGEIEQQRPVALALGLWPQPLIGSRLAMLEDGRTVGAIDGALDPQLIAAAGAAWARGGTQVLRLPWHGEEAGIFIEVIPPPLRLFIIGATHTATALCRMAKDLGFWVSVVDARGTYATRERFPAADEIRIAAPAEVLGSAALDAYSHIVILTHDPKFDIPALTYALRSEARYIGALGSRGTQARRIAVLEQDGFAANDLRRIRAPIGLDIGARTPEEIALAIVAEMVAVRYDRDGRALRDKIGAIHERT